jgi:hypothetical protein
LPFLRTAQTLAAYEWVQFVGELPVVTVWPMIGPLLRIRSQSTVFTSLKSHWEHAGGFAHVMNHCWLANPLPPFPGGSIVTFAPELEDRLVRASPPISRRSPFGQAKRLHEVVPFWFGLRIAAEPGESLLGVPR